MVCDPNNRALSSVKMVCAVVLSSLLKSTLGFGLIFASYLLFHLLCMNSAVSN